MRPRLVLLVLLAFWLGTPTVASAGDVTTTDRGGVPKRLGLSKQERSALDIASVRVYAQRGLGLVAVATFKGNVERALGRGRLVRGAVALILNPPRGRPAAIVATGDRVLTRVGTKDVSVVVAKRQMAFIVASAGVGDLETVELRSFASDPRKRRGARAAQEGRLGGVGAFAGDDADSEADEAIVRADLEELDCEELTELLVALNRQLSFNDSDLDEVERELKDLGRRIRRAKGERAKRLEARRDRKLNERAYLREDNAEITRLLSAASAVYEARCGTPPPGPAPPPPPPPPPAPALTGTFAWSFFSLVEVVLEGRFDVTPQGAATAPVTAVKVVVPPNGATPRAIVNQLCPAQLPTTEVTTTTNPNDTLVCSGGSVAPGETIRANVRTDPPPTAGMGGQVFGMQDGTFKGPFAISGP